MENWNRNFKAQYTLHKQYPVKKIIEILVKYVQDLGQSQLEFASYKRLDAEMKKEITAFIPEGNKDNQQGGEGTEESPWLFVTNEEVEASVYQMKKQLYCSCKYYLKHGCCFHCLVICKKKAIILPSIAPVAEFVKASSKGRPVKKK